MTDDPIVVLREKGEQQSSRSIILQDAAYEAVRKITVIPIQDIKKQFMTTLNQKKAVLIKMMKPP